MSKSKPHFPSNFRKYFNAFDVDIFTTNGKILFCKVCYDEFSADNKCKHIENVGKNRKRNFMFFQTLITNSSKSTFNSDLCKALLCNK